MPCGLTTRFASLYFQSPSRIPESGGTVICFGRIAELTDEQEKDRRLRQIGAKYFPEGYDLEKDMARNASNALIMEITIDHMSGKHVREK